MENKLLLKTEMFGYSKKGVEDYILKLNREFDRRLSEAGADFAKAREEFEQKSKQLEEERKALAENSEEKEPGESSGEYNLKTERLRELEEERPALEEEIRWLESERRKCAEQLKRAEEDNLRLTEELNARLAALRDRQEEPVFPEEEDPAEEDEEEDEVLLELEDENKSLREMNIALEQEYARIKERLRLAEQPRSRSLSREEGFPARSVLSRPAEPSGDSESKALPAEEFYKVFSAIRFFDESFMDT